MESLTNNRLLRFKEIGYLTLISLLMNWSVAAAYTGDLEEGDVTVDGLTVIMSSASTEKQIKKDVRWSDYGKYQIAPVEVSFRKDWKQDYNRDQKILLRRVTDEDMARIRKTIGRIVFEEFHEALKNRAGLKEAAEADSSTLLFKPRIINLDLYAPDVGGSPGIDRTYARQFLQATLFLEVYDAVSGEILARWVDTRKDPDYGYFDWANRITNAERARIVVRSWTKRMVEGLEKLRTGQ